MLLAYNAYPNYGDPAPLLYAVHNGDYAATKLLLTVGANPNTQNASLSETADNNSGDSFSHKTPLDIAVDNNDKKIAALLLKHGANPNISSPTPLLQSIQQGKMELAKLLIQHGAIAGKTVVPHLWAHCDPPVSLK